MALHKFGPNDIFVSRTITNPKVHFLIYSGSYYYNNRYPQSGTWSDPVLNVNTGSISLYELNVDRPSNSFIYPYITKGSTLTSFKTISQTDFMSDFNYGDEITGSYPMLLWYVVIILLMAVRSPLPLLMCLIENILWRLKMY